MVRYHSWTIIAAITDDREGRFALVEAVAEAKQLGGDLVVVNLGSTPHRRDELCRRRRLPSTSSTAGARTRKTPPTPCSTSSPLGRRPRLVIGVKRRTAVGKALLGSLSQRLLLHSPVPVLAVKLPDDGLASSAFDSLPAGLRRVTG